MRELMEVLVDKPLADIAEEGADNVAVYLQAGATLSCGNGNVFSHPSNGERISARRPAVLAASPNRLWPHPASEFGTSLELEQLGHGWVWPLPHLAQRMPDGWREDGQRDETQHWPMQWRTQRLKHSQKRSTRQSTKSLRWLQQRKKKYHSF